MFWTRPYIFFDRNVVGITASIARKGNNGDSQIVVAFDVLLDDLFNEIQRMAPSKNSRVFVFRNDAQIYVPTNGSGPSDFLSLGEVNDLLIRKVVASWEERHLSSDEVFFIDHDRHTWWCSFQAMDGANRNVWVGVMVPEPDIIGGVSHRRVELWTIGAELHKNLIFDLVQVDGEQIGVVSCRRSAEPVYLKTAKSEEFYIRSGPSSDALPISKIVAYIQNRR